MDIQPEQFITCLRSALHHLYDPDQLRRSPLTRLFEISGRVDASFALQKILIDAIEGIRPDENEPPQSRGWLLYEVLFFRYVRGYERQAVANQLGISDRQLSRDQRAALETLAQYLWKTCYLDIPPDSLTSSPDPVEGEAVEEIAARSSISSTDPAWMESLPAEKPTAWKPALLSVLDLLRPLAARNETTLDYEPDENLPDLPVPQNAFRHSLLNILGVMVPLARRSALRVVPAVNGRTLVITAENRAPESGKAPSEPPIAPAESPGTDAAPISNFPGLEVAQGLLERAGGSLSLVQEPGRMWVTFTIPTLAQVPVLVVDDNPDTIQLFQRYGQGTRYAILGASGPAEFYHALDTHHPRIIILDVMMPELDGWDLLVKLRQERQAQDTAIILCSILPQEALALSLGADGFLQKPVLPQDFLQALDDQMDHMHRAKG